MDPAWVLEVKAQCDEAGVAFFFKQWGGRNKKATGRKIDGQTFDEMPRSRELEDRRPKRVVPLGDE